MGVFEEQPKKIACGREEATGRPCPVHSRPRDTATRPFSGGRYGHRDDLVAALVSGGMTERAANLALDTFASGVILAHTDLGGCDAMGKEYREATKTGDSK